MENFNTITADELKAKMDSEDDFILIDVLGDDSYRRAHLPEAIHASVGDEKFLETVETEAPEKDREIVVYCASFSCGASPKAAKQLVAAGYENVIDYEGGLKDWAEHGYNLEGEEAEAVQSSLAESEE